MPDEIDQSVESQRIFRDEMIAQARNSSPGKQYTSSDGYCVLCGEKIPEARLKLLPGTGLCVDCANEKENEAKLPN